MKNGKYDLESIKKAENEAYDIMIDSLDLVYEAMESYQTAISRLKYLLELEREIVVVNNNI